MTPQTVFLFSGQGSQYFHMGRSLYDGNATFREWMERLDALAQQALGTSVVDALYSGRNGKSDPFDRILLTHPAIFMVEYSLARALMASGVRPDMVLGASLGSFAAAAVAGFIGAEDALHAVIRQASVIDECGEAGGMTAVLAEPALFAEEFIRGRSELAAINFSSHFVVSARRMDLAEIEAALAEREIVYQRLPVSFPFHSRWIEKAESGFASAMAAVRCERGRVPLVCCDRAEILAELPAGYFWDVVRRPIRFTETMARLEREGARRYIDAGPAGTLATFLKYGLPANSTSTVHAILTPFGSDQQRFAAVVGSIGS